MSRMVIVIILIIEILIPIIIRKGRDRLSEMGDFLYKVSHFIPVVNEKTVYRS